MKLDGTLADCILLSYRTPADQVRPLIPRHLTLSTRGPWAFWNIVACRIDRLRPAALPPWLGISYHHVAYRLLVEGGLYFVRSDVDSRPVAWLGNLLTDLRSTFAPIHLSVDSLELPDARLAFRSRTDWSLLPESCFFSIDEARSFLKYRPVAFGSQGRRLEVQRDERRWFETPIEIVDAKWPLLDGARLELAARVRPIDYRWVLIG
jgi:hypothetical protein